MSGLQKTAASLLGIDFPAPMDLEHKWGLPSQKYTPEVVEDREKTYRRRYKTHWDAEKKLLARGLEAGAALRASTVLSEEEKAYLTQTVTWVQGLTADRLEECQPIFKLITALHKVKIMEAEVEALKYAWEKAKFHQDAEKKALEEEVKKLDALKKGRSTKDSGSALEAAAGLKTKKKPAGAGSSAPAPAEANDPFASEEESD